MLKVVYVLSAAGWNRYAKMTWLSASSVRRVQPNVDITVLVDDDTWDHSRSALAPLEQVVDRLIRVETGLVDKVRSGMTMKTLARQVVDGDYIFVDCDIIATSPFADMLEGTEHFAACLDCNLPPGSPQLVPRRYRELLNRLGWVTEMPRYVNTGVLASKDTAESRQLSIEWTRRYRICLEHDCWDDQPAFNISIADQQLPVRICPPAYNAMVLIDPALAKHGILLHFFASHANVYGTLMSHLMGHLDKTGELDVAALENCKRLGHPWEPDCEAWQLWQSKNYVRAVARKIGKTLLRRDRTAAIVSQ